MKKFLLIFFLLGLGGCRWFTEAGTPYLQWTNFKVPEGTPAFQKGYKDGCSSVLYARSNVFYRARYGYRYDPKMIGNPEYRFGHSRGYTWCFQHALQGHTGAIGSPDKLLNPFGYDSTFNAGHVDNLWGGFFGGSGSGGATWGSITGAGGFGGTFDVFQKGSSGDGSLAEGDNAFANPLWAGGSKGQFFGQ